MASKIALNLQGQLGRKMLISVSKQFGLGHMLIHRNATKILVGNDFRTDSRALSFGHSPYHIQEMPAVLDEEKCRTTFADHKPVEVNSKLVNLIQAALKNEECIHSESSDVPQQHSDEFLNSFSSKEFALFRGSSAVSSRPLSSFVYLNSDGRRWYSNHASSKVNASQNEENKPPEDEVPKSKTSQLKNIFAIYGSFAVGFHIVISLMSLGICYLAVSSGVDIVALLNKVGIELSSVASGASTMVIAYAVHKILMPIRITITVVSVPVLVRHLRKIGYLKR